MKPRKMTWFFVGGDNAQHDRSAYTVRAGRHRQGENFYEKMSHILLVYQLSDKLLLNKVIIIHHIGAGDFSLMWGGGGGVS